jgi:hypothetical protein
MAVRWATRPDQQTLVGTLATLPDLVVTAGMRPAARRRLHAPDPVGRPAWAARVISAMAARSYGKT